MIATLVKLSFCKCGYPALKSEIQLGQEYQIDWDQQGPGLFCCGGCHTVIPCTLIWIKGRIELPTDKGGWLPKEIFTFNAMHFPA